jgi:hypothetical protein
MRTKIVEQDATMLRVASLNGDGIELRLQGKRSSDLTFNGER